MSESSPPQLELRRMIHLTRVIGEGGMGRVLDGFAPDLGQYVAVKILRAEYANNPEIRARFEAEVALLAQIDHPGCPTIYGSGQDDDGLPCYAMKKVEGCTLADLLVERGGATRNAPWRRRLLAILLEVSETIAYAHELGIIHRDIKPENILIDRHQSVYLIDWGVAKRITPDSGQQDSRLTLPGKVMGSPGYMAPEQVEGRGSDAGPQADVYALGTILYEILCGHRPFGGAGGREEMLATVHHDPKPPRHFNWRLPRSINGICMKALNKNPALRYADARGLAADLRAFLEGRLSTLEHARAAARSHPLRAIACAVLAITGIGLTVLLLDQFWTDQQLARRAMSRVTELDAGLAKIAAEEESLRGQLEKSKNGSPAKAELRKQLRQLDTRWVLTEYEAQRLLASVAELRFVRAESEIAPLAKQRLMKLIESSMARDQSQLAGSLIRNELDRHQNKLSALDWQDHEIAQLRDLATKAELRAITPSAP